MGAKKITFLWVTRKVLVRPAITSDVVEDQGIP
jgi:hypothetical protein